MIIDALMVLACLLAVLLVAELGLRWADGMKLLSLQNFAGQHTDMPGLNGSGAYPRTLGWRRAPKVQARGGEGTLTTDDLGTRLPSTEPRALPIGAILASGDSFTAGSEVSDQETWPAQ